ncbi:MAG: tryptophan synthase subunit alpha [Defluviitaleaceae bacterium]|nr:tryptophan synthase subunit alpha [Defluviitaleaceae bacterium]MCL2262561.1 tryptophan synthase subunit alpha [Defluviitaleaceae bacterium]
MNRIAEAFKGKKALIAFLMGGDPDICTTEKLIIAMAEAGVDIFEIGIPFSDPAADGPVIQAASVRALEKGCTADDLLNMVQRVREKISTPIVFLTYANSIFAYGKERFMERCRDCGVDGVVVPDIPHEERGELSDACEKFGITQIALVAPTSEERVEKIARNAEGFIYCVSTLGVTGIRDEIRTNITATISKVRNVSQIPCAVGFGISTPEQARDMASVSDGAIIGSAIVKIIGEYGAESVEPVRQYISRVRSEMDVIQK